ncbi:MAG: hypothetical protein ACJA01_004618, partial [Saprospiraceae bacterium]
QNMLFIQLEDGAHLIASDDAIIDQKWNHFAISYNEEAGTLAMYKNGVPIINGNVKQNYYPAYSSTGQLFVGKHAAGNSRPFRGLIHELRLWNIPRLQEDISSKSTISLSGRESGLIGNWPMNEAFGNKGNDKVRARHMAIEGATWAVSPASHSFEFSGNENYLKVEDAGQLSFSEEADLTFEAWIRPASLGNKMSILSNGHPSDTAPSLWDIFIDPSSNLIISNNGNELVGPPILLNEWQHIAIVIERTRAVSIYLNGQLVNTGNASIFKDFGALSLYIGSRGQIVNNQESIDQFFTGLLDEIRIWNVARKPEQIRRDFINQLYGNEPGLVAYYPFDIYTRDDTGALLPVPDPTLEDKSIEDIFYFNLVEYGTGQFMSLTPTIRLPRQVVDLTPSWSVNSDQIFLEIDKEPNRIENVTFDITVRGIRDLAGNVMESPETWIAYINKNQVFWEEEYFQFEKKLEDNLSFKAKIKNTGGSQESYNLSNLPSWLSASPSSGLIEPNSSVEVTFSVQPLLNIGEYEQDVFVTTESFGFNERLLLDLKVAVDPPEWVIDEDAFPNSMNITGQLLINDVISTDPEDMVSVWVNDSLRGVSHVEFDPSSGKDLVFLTILSDSASMDPLVFKAWDASRGRLLVDLEPLDLVYTNNQILGSRSNPLDIKATVLTELTYAMKPGWNWISFPLAAAVLSDANLTLQELSPTENDQMNYPGKNHVFSAGSWLGGDALSTDRGYKIKLAKADTFRYEGTFVEPSLLTEIMHIDSGWNWIGVKSEFIIDVPSAMASLDPQTGDVIKGQRSFALYEDGFGWGGNLDFLKPQDGYMLKYHKADQLIYPGNLNAREKPETQLKSRSQRGKAYAALEKSLDYATGQYSSTMSLIAEIDACIALNAGDAQLDLSQWSLVAHAGDECRGLVESTWQSITGKYVYYLSIEGSSGVDLNFQLVHNTNGGKISLSQTMQFVSNGVTGMNSSPYQFTCIPVDDCLETSLFQSGDIDMSQMEMEHRVMMDLRSDALLPSDRIYRFRAGNSIELIRGFEVSDKAILEAYIEDCITTKQ